MSSGLASPGFPSVADTMMPITSHRETLLFLPFFLSSCKSFQWRWDGSCKDCSLSTQAWMNRPILWRLAVWPWQISIEFTSIIISWVLFKCHVQGSVMRIWRVFISKERQTSSGAVHTSWWLAVTRPWPACTKVHLIRNPSQCLWIGCQLRERMRKVPCGKCF